jgi:hypothetical protein
MNKLNGTFLLANIQGSFRYNKYWHPNLSLIYSPINLLNQQTCIVLIFEIIELSLNGDYLRFTDKAGVRVEEYTACSFGCNS